MKESGGRSPPGPQRHGSTSPFTRLSNLVRWVIWVNNRGIFVSFSSPLRAVVSVRGWNASQPATTPGKLSRNPVVSSDPRSYRPSLGEAEVRLILFPGG